MSKRNFNFTCEVSSRIDLLTKVKTTIFTISSLETQADQMENNFYVIYRMITNEGVSHEFITAWENLTIHIQNYCGGLGSKIHKEEEGVFIAYAKWPNKAAWENSTSSSPKEEEKLKLEMRKYCSKVEVLHTVYLVSDLMN